MKALGLALEAGKAQGYEQNGHVVERRREGGPFGRWLIKLFGSGDRGSTYSRPSVAANITSDYGESVGRQVMARVGAKPLTARRIVNLHNQASKLKQTIDTHNTQHSKSWMNLDKKGSLASQVFSRSFGYSPQRLPDYERNRLQQHLEVAFYNKGDHELSRQEARQLVSDVLHDHDTALAGAAPEVARVLGDVSGYGYESGTLYPENLNQWLNAQPLNDYDRNLARAFQYNSSQSARLTSRSPLEQLDKKQWSEQIEDVRHHISSLKTSLDAISRGALGGLHGVVRQAFALDIYHQLNQGQQHIHYLEGLEKADFRGAGQLRKAEEHGLDTALQVLHSSLEKAQTGGKPQKAEALGRLIEDLNGRKEHLDQKKYEPVTYMKKAINADIKILQKELIKAGVNPRELKKTWGKTSVAVTNSREWTTIEKLIPVREDGRLYHYKSKLVPAGQMRFTRPGQPVGNRDPFLSSYSGRGRSSGEPTERIHAINMYENEVISSDGRTLYKGLRSGTLFPVKIKDKKKQLAILENRAMEVFQAAFAQKYAALSPKQQQSIIDGTTLSFNMVATSLLSPDQIRHMTGINDDEFTFQDAQNQMLQSLSAKPVALRIYDSHGRAHKVTADIQLTSLNIPVNKFGLDSTLSTVARTWEKADLYNQIGLDKLLGNSHPDSDIDGVVGDWFRGAGQKSPDREKVQQLVYQIRTLYTQGLHHLEGNDAYKLVERVKFLTFMIGAVPHFNCKSGKDRTGEADARIKQLAAEVDRLGYIPDPLAPVTQEHREAVQAFMYGSGNLEVQQQNTGVPHYKTALGKEEVGEELFKLIH